MQRNNMNEKSALSDGEGDKDKFNSVEWVGFGLVYIGAGLMGGGALTSLILLEPVRSAIGLLGSGAASCVVGTGIYCTSRYGLFSCKKEDDSFGQDTVERKDASSLFNSVQDEKRFQL